MNQQIKSKDKQPGNDVKRDSGGGSDKSSPLWLFASIGLLLASLISYIYIRLKKPELKARPEKDHSFQPTDPGQSGQNISLDRSGGSMANAQGPINQRMKQPQLTGNNLTDKDKVASVDALPVVPELDRTKKKNLLFIAFPLLALLIAYFAQGVFDTTREVGVLHDVAWLSTMPAAARLWLGAVLYLISTLMWVFTAPVMRSFEKVIDRPDSESPPKVQWGLIHKVPLFICAGTFLVSNFIFFINEENGFVRGLWALGLFVFVLSQFFWTEPSVDHFEQEESPRFRWQNWLVLSILLGIAFWLRFYQLTTIPDDFHGDSASYGLIARNFITGEQQTIFNDGVFSNTPMMDFLSTYYSMSVFGNNLFGLLMTSVINGMLSLLAVYLLVWRLFDNHRLAAITTALVVINVVHIQASRIAIILNPWAFGYFAMFFLIDGLKARRAASLGLAGVLLGFCSQSYFAGRVVIFIIGFFLVYAFFFQRSWIIQNKRGLTLMVIGTILAMGPSLIYHVFLWDSFASRTREVFLFSEGTMNHLLNKYNTDSPFFVLLMQIQQTALMFNNSVDSGGMFGFFRPMFNSLVSPLIILGAGVSLRRWKDAPMFLILIWLVLMSVLGSIMTIDAPPWTHLAGIVPAAALLIGIAFEQIFELGRNVFGKHAATIVTVLISILLVIVGHIDWSQYYLDVKENGSPTTAAGRFISTLPADVTACSLTNGDPLAVRETAFLAWPRKLVDIRPDAPDSDLALCTGSALVWVISPENLGRLDVIRARWPGGVIQTHRFPHYDYKLTFYLYNTAPLPEKNSLMNMPLWLTAGIFGLLFFLISQLFVYLSNTIKSRQMIALSEEKQQLEYKRVFRMNWIKSLSKGLPSTLNSARTKNVFSSIAFLLLSIAIAYFAQSIFDSISGIGFLHGSTRLAEMSVPNRLWLGAGVYLIAMLIWMFNVPMIIYVTDLAVHRQSVSDLSEKTKRKPGYFILLFVGISIYFVSMLLYITSGENQLIRGLWLAGLTCFLISQFLRFRNASAAPDAEESPSFHWPHWLVLACVLVVAFALRFYQLAILPADLHGDMASYGLLARDIVLGNQQDIFGDGYYGIPIMGFLPAAFTMGVFGNNILGLQMISVIGGVLSIFAVYLLVWRIFDSHRLALLTAIVISLSAVHIHFSRIAAYMDPWLFGYFALFFLIDGLRARRTPSFGLAGVFLTFSLQMYFSGRVLVFIIALLLLYAFFFHRPWILQNTRGLTMMLIGALIAMGPALIFHLIHWDSFMSRSREVLIFTPGPMEHLLNKYNVDSLFSVLLIQLKLTALMFNQTGDTSTQFGFSHPMFFSIISPLIILGLGSALRRWKDAGMALALIWLGLMAVLGSILTLDAPFWPRLVGIIPAAALLIALALNQILEFWKYAFGGRMFAPIAVLVSVLLLVNGYINWTEYYFFAKDNASVTTAVGRYINKLPADVTACSLLSGPPLAVRETAFLAWPHKLVDILPDAPDSELDTCTGSSLIWVISPENTGRLDAIKARWPNGVLQEYYLPRPNYLVTFYMVNVDLRNTQSYGLFDQAPWLPAVKALAFNMIILAVLLWLFVRFAYPGISDWWQRRINAAYGQVQRQTPGLPGGTGKSTGLQQWFGELVLLDLPVFNLKFVVSFLLPILIVGLAYFAQTFLDQQRGDGLHLLIASLSIPEEGRRLAVAGIIFLTATLAWIFLTADQESDLPVGWSLKNLRGKVFLSPINRNTWRTLFSPLQWAGILFVIVAIFFYAFVAENALVRWLWLTGLILFTASLFVKRQVDTEGPAEESPSFAWYHTLTLFLLLILAFSLRVYRLYDIPLDLSTDMASVGIGTREYLLGIEQRVFGTGWYYMPRISFLPYVASMTVAGNNLFGLYFGTVVMGTINILGVYLFVWRLFDRHRLAFLTALLVVINPGHINFSRITSYVDPWFLAFLGLFFFFDGLKGRRKASLAIAGIFTGFTLVSYASGRVIVLLIAAALICAWVYKREWITDNYKGFAWMLAGIFVSLGPNLVYFITDWSVYMQRSREVLIFNPGVAEHLKNKYNVVSMGGVVWEQIKRSVLMFNYYTDVSAQFSYPHAMFNSLVSPLLILGFGMCLHRWKKLSFTFALTSFIFILVIGGILTEDAPTWVRLVGIIPFAALMIALVLDEFVNILSRTSLKPFAPVLFVVLLLFLSSVAWMDWNTYIKEVENLARPVVRAGRYVDSLPDDVTACGITEGYPMTQEEITFLGWPHTIVAVPPETTVLNNAICPGKNVAWILSPAYQNRLPELMAQWPGGTLEQHFVREDLIFISYLYLTDMAVP